MINFMNKNKIKSIKIIKCNETKNTYKRYLLFIFEYEVVTNFHTNTRVIALLMSLITNY